MSWKKRYRLLSEVDKAAKEESLRTPCFVGLGGGLVSIVRGDNVGQRGYFTLVVVVKEYWRHLKDWGSVETLEDLCP